MRRGPLIAAVLVAVLTAPGTAAAQDGPVVERVACTAGCAAGDAQAGATLRIAGEGLDDVGLVGFLGEEGPGDEAAAAPLSTDDGAVVVLVPPEAAAGPVLIADRALHTTVSEDVPVAPTALPEDTSSPVATAITAREARLDGPREPTLAYRVNGDEPADVTVSVVREGTDEVAATFEQGVVAPGQTQTVSWGADPGRYRFVVDAGAVTAEEPFRVQGDAYPLPEGATGYGDTLGAGRGHMGTDVFAECGSPVLASRGGRVERNAFEGAAGNYLVVDQDDTGVDAVYMHLRAPSRAVEGDRVETGEPIGKVGDTGRASECHLHYELWSAPGWYAGGEPIDAMGHLKALEKR